MPQPNAIDPDRVLARNLVDYEAIRQDVWLVRELAARGRSWRLRALFLGACIGVFTGITFAMRGSPVAAVIAGFGPIFVAHWLWRAVYGPKVFPPAMLHDDLERRLSLYKPVDAGAMWALVASVGKKRTLEAAALDAWLDAEDRAYWRLGLVPSVDGRFRGVDASPWIGSATYDWMNSEFRRRLLESDDELDAAIAAKSQPDAAPGGVPVPQP